MPSVVHHPSLSHPVCCRCNFDLRRAPADADWRARCPSCGAVQVISPRCRPAMERQQVLAFDEARP